MTEKLNLIETIKENSMFSTFCRVMITSGANEALEASGDFTVFAPTNDAFCKIPDIRMNALLQENNQITLKTLLLYHIVPERMLAASLGSKHRAATVSGVEVIFSDGRDGLKVNDSFVQARNIEASNGVIHGIDTLLNYDIEIFSTGPLSPPVDIRRAALSPELVVPRLRAGRSSANGSGR